MFITKLGYVFECRKDCQGNLGFLESYKVQYSATTTTVNITCGIDANGNLADLFMLDTLQGFRTVASKVEESPSVKEGLEKFIRSNRAVLGVVPNAINILVAKLVFDNQFNSLILDKSVINFYTPCKVLEDISIVVPADKLKRETPCLGVLTKILVAGVSESSTTFGTTKVVLDAYRQAAIRNLPFSVVKDKESYYNARICRRLMGGNQ